MLGATVYVTEVDPICAIQAWFFYFNQSSEGIEVVSVESVIGIVDAVILCTGNTFKNLENKDIIGYNDIENMKNNCLIINYGHSSSELNIVLFLTYRNQLKTMP